MQNVYACRLDIPENQTDLALGLAAKWLWGDKAHRESWDEPSEGGSPKTSRRTRKEYIESGMTRLWDATLTHPHQDDESVSVVARIEVLANQESPTSFLTTLELRRDEGDVRPIQLPMNAPALPRTVISSCDCEDSGRPLRESAELLQAKEVPDFVEFLLDPDRERPVVLVTHDTRLDLRYVDESLLARELAGLAHVFFTNYGLPASELRKELGPDLAAWGGAARVWWPGVTPTAGRFENPLFVPWRLTKADGLPAPRIGMSRIRERIWRVASDSMFQPASHREVKRAVRVERLKASQDATEFIEALDQTMDELDAEKDLTARMQERVDQLTDERDDARRETEMVRRQFAEFQASQAETTTTRKEQDFTPATVAEAVQYAEENFLNLEFVPRAHESAADSPFTRPELILDDLRKLNELASLERQPNGIGRKRKDAAEELGLTWRGGVSQTARGKYPEEYSVVWRGERIELGPHVNLGSGKGAGNIARIYFYCHEAQEPNERCYVIGHVGRKLPDSTTG